LIKKLQDKNNILDKEYKKLILEEHLPWIIKYTITLPSIYYLWKRRFNDLNHKYEEFIETSVEEGVNNCLVLACAVGQRNLLQFLGIKIDEGKLNNTYRPIKNNERKDEPFITDFDLEVININSITNQLLLLDSFTASNNLLHFNWQKSNEDKDSTQIICDASLEVVKLIKTHVYDSLKIDFQEAIKLTHKELALIGEGK
jgi:hypothetical protein